MLPEDLVQQIVQEVIQFSDIDASLETSLQIYSLLSKIMIFIQKTQYLPGPEKKELAIRAGRIVLEQIVKDNQSFLLEFYDHAADDIVEVLYWTSKQWKKISPSCRSRVFSCCP